VSNAVLVVSVPNEELRDTLDDHSTDVRVIVWDMAGPSPEPQIDMVIPPYMSTLALLDRLRGVRTRLVQSQSDGYDGVGDALPPGHVFANAASVHETATSELALTLILASQRGVADFVRAAAQGRWAPGRYRGLADCRVLLVGYGGIGKAIEDRLIPFEVDIVRVARTARDTARGSVHAIDELGVLLPDADVVVVAVPLTEATRHLIDDAFLARVRDGALVVNVSRGPVGDTDALVAHASSGRIRLALDVTDPEPLPDGHRLFSLANVLISPHVGGATSAMTPRLVRLVREQIDRMIRGDEPLNVVIRS